VSPNPAFVFIKVSPLKREEAYREIVKFPVQRIFRVAGDMDAILIVEREKLDEALQKLAFVKGIQDTKSYVAIKPIK
ncbi:MAG: Lrp/AsnC ligand binding domain-containing protein, partial [Candidatus Bathyarchaeota archaeon]|nr:Lrp/AsnC ligand binding domain-containing protein [Candidatus Bathyarchaeota archaeon]